MRVRTGAASSTEYPITCMKSSSHSHAASETAQALLHSGRLLSSASKALRADSSGCSAQRTACWQAAMRRKLRLVWAVGVPAE